MPHVTTRVPTLHASRYLQQLCKHWSHRFETEFDPDRGRVNLPAAELRLAAEETGLSLTLEGHEADALPRLTEVVADHLRRFAFREELVFEWSPVSTD